MQFHRSIVSGADLEAACRDATSELRAGLGEGPIDLAIVFASPRYGAVVDRLPVHLQDMLGARAIVGCSGASLVADGQALHGRHGITVLAARMPDTHVDVVAVAPGDQPSPDAPPDAWRRLLPERDQPRTGMIVLAEPFHCDPRALLAGLDFGFPGIDKIGGIASGSRHPEGHTLFCGRQTHRSGAVVVALAGAVGIDAVVASGCRAFGRAGRVTKADGNRLLAIDDQPARRFVQQQLAALPAADREVAQGSPLLLGLSPDPFTAAAEHDFLVRNILGVDAEGELVTCQHVTVGRSVRLLMRDRDAGSRQLRTRLAAANPSTSAAALLFQCLGRESEDHAQFAADAPGVPMAGFHCNGEIGPLAGDTHLHAFSAAFGLFRRRGPA